MELSVGNGIRDDDSRRRKDMGVVSRRAILSKGFVLAGGLFAAAATTEGLALPTFAQESNPQQPQIPNPPTSSTAEKIAPNRKMSGDYKSDASAVLESMKQAWELPRGAPHMTDTVASTRKQMNDFVAMYRRNDKVSGSVSFSTLYTAINTLSGHYASFGPSYPVPEKRKKRLNTQFKEINKALARNR